MARYKNKLFSESRVREDDRVISEIKEILEYGIPYLIAHPGIGKTSIIKKLNSNNLIYNVSNFNEIDLIGKGSSMPLWYNELYQFSIKCNDKKERCLLVFDDFHNLEPSLQKYIFGLIQEPRKLGNFVIPENVDVLLCGDSEEYTDPKYVLNFKLNASLHKVETKVEINEWMHYANNNGINNIIKSYLNEYPSELLKDVKDGSNYNPKLSLTPKSWAERINTELYLAEKLNQEVNLDNYMDSKTRDKFLGFMKKFNELKINDIIKGKTGKIDRFTYTSSDISFITNALIVSTYSIDEIKNALSFFEKVGHSEYRDLYMSIWSSINDYKEELIKIKKAIISSMRKGESDAEI